MKANKNYWLADAVSTAKRQRGFTKFTLADVEPYLNNPKAFAHKVNTLLGWGSTDVLPQEFDDAYIAIAFDFSLIDLNLDSLFLLPTLEGLYLYIKDWDSEEVYYMEVRSIYWIAVKLIGLKGTTPDLEGFAQAVRQALN